MDPSQAGGFVGRDAELRRLHELLDQAAAGAPSALLIRGEAGVGKSSLLRQFALRAGQAGAQVVWGACVPFGEGEIPFAPLIDALRRLVRSLGAETVRELAGPEYPYLAGLLPGAATVADGSTTRVEGAAGRLLRFGALLHLLEQLGGDQPVVLAIEDLQWADKSTVDFLSYLCRAWEDQRLLVVATFRVGELSPVHAVRVAVGELERARATQVIDLGGFDPTELRDYLRGVPALVVTHDLVERAMDLTVGNPLFVAELVAAGTLSAGEGGALPATVIDLLLPRYERLGNDAKKVIHVAAVIGRRCSHPLLAAVCGLPASRLLAGLRECAAREMLVTDPRDDTYRFGHPLLREVVYQQLILGDRLRLHRLVAGALMRNREQGYAEELTATAELSYHWSAARAFPEALASAVEAGSQALTLLAFQEAYQHLERALNVWPMLSDPATVAGLPGHRLRAMLADAARWSGRLEQAVTLTRAAITQVDRDHEPVVAGELYERLGSYLWEAGDYAPSADAYGQAVTLLSGAPPSAVAARVLAVSATLHIQRGAYSRGLELGRGALEMAELIGARAEQGRALNSIGLALTLLDQATEGIETLTRALRIAEEGRAIEDHYRAYGNLVFALEHVGRLEDAVAMAMEGLAKIRQAGLEHTAGRAVLANNAGAAMVQLGQWDGATSMLDQIGDHAEKHRVIARLTLAVVNVGRGRFDEADGLLAQVEQAGAGVRQPQFIGGWHACVAELAIWRGQPDVARDAVRNGLRTLVDVDNPLEPLRLCALGLRVEADHAHRAGARRRAAAARVTPSAVDQLMSTVERLATGVETAQHTEAGVLVGLCRAEQARARAEDTLDTWVAVADRWRELRRPYPLAYALWRATEAGVREARDLGQPAGSAAVRRLRGLSRAAGAQALDLATRLGAQPLRAAIDGLDQRARLGLAAAAAPPAQVPAGLSRREQQVLTLVTQGLRDKQIAAELYLSVRTVQTHVKNIRRKLGVSARGQFAAVVRDLEAKG